MPFKSQAQRRFMYSQHPKMAREFEEKTPKGSHLPERVEKGKDSTFHEAAEKRAGMSCSKCGGRKGPGHKCSKKGC